MVALFLTVSFGWAWAFWYLCALISAGSVDLPLTITAIIGSFGPFIGAGVCTALQNGWRGMLRFYARALQWRMGWDVFLASLLLLPAIGVLAAEIYALQHSRALTLQIGVAQLPMIYIWLFFFGGAVGEEFGWSYLADCLDGALPVAVGTLLLGVIWGFWHLPLFFLTVPGLTQRYMPFIAFLLMLIALRFVFSWAYHRGGRSVLSNLLFHNAFNLTITMVVIIVPAAHVDHLRLWYLTALSFAAAVVLWRAMPPREMSYPAPDNGALS